MAKSKKRAVKKRAQRRPADKHGPGKTSEAPAQLDPSEAPNKTRLHLALAVLSGCMWFIASPNIDLWWLAWAAAVPMLVAIEGAPTRRRAVLYAWLGGTVANVGGFYWISALLERFAHFPTPIAWIGLVCLGAYQALLFLVFGWIVRDVRRYTREHWNHSIPMVLVAPMAMAAMETVMPYLFPFYFSLSQAWNPLVLQISELTGPAGVTALLVVSAGAIYDIATESSLRRRLIPAAGAVLVIGGALIFGAVRMAAVDQARANAPTLNIGVVQANIAFDDKGRRGMRSAQLRALQQKSAELEAQGAEFLMWTESAYPYAIDRRATRDFRQGSRGRIRRGFSVPLMLGSVTHDGADKEAYPYNSALMLDSDGAFTARFDKIYLLMFGEYIPGLETFPFLRQWMPRASGHFARGEDVVTFPLEHEGKAYRLGPMICYEDILPSFGRKLAAHHPHLLVNITNDAWFGETSEPWEHLGLSVFRAIEMRTDLVRAVNTGVSAFIDANGRVVSKTYAVDPKVNPRDVDGLLGEAVLMEGGHSFYARFGDVFGYLTIAGTLLLWLGLPLRRRRRQRRT